MLILHIPLIHIIHHTYHTNHPILRIYVLTDYLNKITFYNSTFEKYRCTIFVSLTTTSLSKNKISSKLLDREICEIYIYTKIAQVIVLDRYNDVNTL